MIKKSFIIFLSCGLLLSLTGCASIFPSRDFKYTYPNGLSFECKRGETKLSLDPEVAKLVGEIVKAAATKAQVNAATKAQVNAATKAQGNGGATTQGNGGATTQGNGGATTQGNGGATTQGNGGATTQSNGGATTQSNGGATTQSNGGATTQSNGGATTQSNGGATTQGQMAEHSTVKKPEETYLLMSYCDDFLNVAPWAGIKSRSHYNRKK